MQRLKAFLKTYYDSRLLIKEMALRDFKLKFAGSVFGLFWAVLQPLAMMSILYLVFRYGLKAQAAHGVSFAAWFFSASIVWNFFQDALTSSTNVYMEYSYLVKKVNFRLALLPLIKILSSFILHIVFIAIVLALVIFTDSLNITSIFSLAYFSFCSIALLFGLSWVTSTIQVFYRDMGQLVGIIMQLGFWVTPIAWNHDLLSPEYQRLLKLNPVMYITEGYRGALVYKQSLFDLSLLQTLYFWSVTASFLVLGTFVFKKLKSQFADIL
jgi:teichoic acid transport system permease protein